MADPLIASVIAAFTAGAVAAAQNVTSQALTDAYAGLKTWLVGRLGPDDVNRLERAPDSDGRRAVLAEELEQAGAASDADLKARTEALLAALQELQGQARADALFDFGTLRAAGNFELSDIKASGTVLRANEATFESDVKFSNIEQSDPPRHRR